MQDLTCNKCHSKFDRHRNIPRLLPTCGHTFCTECIISLMQVSDKITCPEDDIIFSNFDPNRGIDCFPANVSLMNLIVRSTFQSKPEEKKETPKENSKSHFCKQHQKVADLICLTDKKIICSKCALFGDHKNHDIKELEDFKQLVKTRVTDFSSEIEKVKKASIKIQNLENISFSNLKIETKKSELFKNIEEICSELKTAINKKEIQTKEKIEIAFEKVFEHAVLISNEAKNMLHKKEVLCKKLEKSNNLLANQEMDFDFFLDNFFSDKEIIFQTKQMNAEFDSFENVSKSILDVKLQNISILVSVENFKEGLGGIITVYDKNVESKNEINPVQTQESYQILPKPQSSLILSDKIPGSTIIPDGKDISPVQDFNKNNKNSKNSTKKRKTEDFSAKMLMNKKNKKMIQSDSSINNSHDSKKFKASQSKIVHIEQESNSEIWPVNNQMEDSSANNSQEEEQIKDVKDQFNDESYSKIEGNNFRESSFSKSNVDEADFENEPIFDDINQNSGDKLMEEAMSNDIFNENQKKNTSFLKNNSKNFGNNAKRYVDNNFGTTNNDNQINPDIGFEEYDNNQNDNLVKKRTFYMNPGHHQSMVKTPLTKNQANVINQRSYTGFAMPGLAEFVQNEAVGNNPQFKTSSTMNRNKIMTTTNANPGGYFLSQQSVNNQGLIGLKDGLALNKNRSEFNQYSLLKGNEEDEYEYVDSKNLFENDLRMRTDSGPFLSSFKTDDEFEINLSSKSINASKIPDILRSIMKNKKAKILNLSYNYLNEKGVEIVLDKIASHPSIDTINFTGNAIDESVFDMLVKKGKTFSKRIRNVIMKEVKSFKSMANIKKQINVLKRMNIKVEI